MPDLDQPHARLLSEHGQGETGSAGSLKEDGNRPSHSGCIHESVRLEEMSGVIPKRGKKL